MYIYPVHAAPLGKMLMREANGARGLECAHRLAPAHTVEGQPSEQRQWRQAEDADNHITFAPARPTPAGSRHVVIGNCRHSRAALEPFSEIERRMAFWLCRAYRGTRWWTVKKKKQHPPQHGSEIRPFFGTPAMQLSVVFGLESFIVMIGSGGARINTWER